MVVCDLRGRIDETPSMPCLRQLYPYFLLGEMELGG